MSGSSSLPAADGLDKILAMRQAAEQRKAIVPRQATTPHGIAKTIRFGPWEPW